MIEIRDLSCGHDGRAVLSGLSSTIRPGEIVALLGSNGAGKSTLLNTMCKSLSPVAGSVLLDGVDTRDLSYAEIARRVAFVPQEEVVPFAFTVAEIVMMGRLARSAGLFDTPEDREVMEASLARCDAGEFAGRRFNELSGGERQRVLMARALAQETPALLLDEPSSHLDLEHQLAMARSIQEFALAGGIVVLAVHDLNYALDLAPRTWLLHEGRMVFDGSTVELIDSPWLERAFKVRFRRVEIEPGVWRLFPKSS